jgi:hypothetical protein
MRALCAASPTLCGEPLRLPPLGSFCPGFTEDINSTACTHTVQVGGEDTHVQGPFKEAEQGGGALGGALGAHRSFPRALHARHHTMSRSGVPL